MQQEFLLNEPDAAKRIVYLFPTTDGVTGKTTGVAGNYPQIAIGSGNFADTINVAVQFAGTTTYPLYYVPLDVSEVATLGHGIICYKDSGSVWFAGIFKIISSSDDISLDELNAKLDSILARVRAIEFKVDRLEQTNKGDPFMSPL